MGKAQFNLRESYLQRSIEKVSQRLENSAQVAREREILDARAVEALQKNIDNYIKEIPGLVEQEVRERTRELKAEVESLKKELSERPKAPLPAAISLSEKSKASTICIFDTLLSAIENWTTDGLTAPDVSLCSQSILFPLVYEQVMRGNEDYYLEKFPSISMEVVRRGRTFVKWLREELPTALNSQDVWDLYADEVRQWWINDGLPLLYGARDDEWSVDNSYSFDDMLKWRDLPASRVLDFPLIADGMELVTQHMDAIREPIGLRNFNQQQIQTRFNHE